MLDASALVPLIVGHGKQLMAKHPGTDLLTTDLAIYEACNAVWKLTKLLGRISLEDALDLAAVIKELTIRGIIEALEFRRLDMAGVLKMAHEERMTFYDASYIVATQSVEATLVTGDEKLRQEASRFVRTTTHSELEGVLSHAGN